MTCFPEKVPSIDALREAAQGAACLCSRPPLARFAFSKYSMRIAEIMTSGFNPRPWLTGKCFDFALALHERMPDADFVVIGSAQMPEHVALRLGDIYYDARGAIPDVHSFLAHHTGEPAELIQPISREDVELHAGVAGYPPPYKGNRDIAAARQAVNAVYGKIAPVERKYRVHFRYPGQKDIFNTLVVSATSEKQARKAANRILLDPGGPWSFYGQRPRIAWID